MTEPQLNEQALFWASHAVSLALEEMRTDGSPSKPDRIARRAITAYLAAALPEVASVEDLEALPIGTVIMPLAYHSATPVLVRDQWGTWAVAGHPSPYSTEVVFLGLHGEPARVLYRPEVEA